MARRNAQRRSWSGPPPLLPLLSLPLPQLPLPPRPSSPQLSPPLHSTHTAARGRRPQERARAQALQRDVSLAPLLERVEALQHEMEALEEARELEELRREMKRAGDHLHTDAEGSSAAVVGAPPQRQRGCARRL